MIKEVYPKLQPVSRVRLIKPRAVTTETPQQGRQPAGQIPGAPRALYKAPTVTG